MRFMSLGSGSSGNCYYLAAGRTAILIDAGIGIRKTKSILKDNGIDIGTIDAVLITHDHLDHVRSAGWLGERAGIPVYATAEVIGGINRNYCIRQKLRGSARAVTKGERVVIGDFAATPFAVPHDSADNVGWRIEAGGRAFVLVTDCGQITDEVKAHATGADYLVIETNYDAMMLENGPYPRQLKERVKSCTGHLCNTEAAMFVADNYRDNLRHVWLCHISQDNNRPEVAEQTVTLALEAAGIAVGRDVEVTPLARYVPSQLYTLE